MEYDLGGDKYLYLSKFRNETLVQIRKFELNEKGKKYPTKKGITMKPWRFANFCDMLDIIEATHKKTENRPDRMRISGKLCAWFTTDWAGLQLREVFRDKEGKEWPSKFKGIPLGSQEWNKLREFAPQLRELNSTLRNAEPCFHHGQMDMLYCYECNPFQDDASVLWKTPQHKERTPPSTPPGVYKPPLKRLRRVLNFR